MTAGCNLHAVFRVPLLRPALLERGFFRGGVADDPTDISSVLRGAGKRRAALTVGRRENPSPDAGRRDFRQPKKSLVEVSRRSLMAGDDLHQKRRDRLSLLREPQGAAGVQRPRDRPAARCQAVAQNLNGALTPEMVTAGSHKKVWWQCPYGHVWKAVIYARTGAQQSGCPVCAEKTKISKPSPRRRAKDKENFRR